MQQNLKDVHVFIYMMINKYGDILGTFNHRIDKFVKQNYSIV